MSYEGPRTEIIRNEEGKIIQLDVHYPHVASEEVAFGIDMSRFSKTYPLDGGFAVVQIGDESQRGDHAGVIGLVAQDTDQIHFADGVDTDSLEDCEPTLIIRQHIGTMGNLAVAVAITSFPMDEAEPHVRNVAMQQMIQNLAEGSSSN